MKIIYRYILTLILCCVAIGTICFIAGKEVGHYNGIIEGIERDAFCNHRFNKANDTIVNGYAHGAEYFVVYTKGRTFEEIASTTFHELAHIYASADHEHFTNRGLSIYTDKSKKVE